MHILFAGGGTAGHINPALAVAGYLKKNYPDTRVSYIGTPRGLESRLVPAAGYDFYTIEASGFQRRLTPSNIKKNISAAVKAVKASGRAKKLLCELKPDIVVGTGGYVSGPVLRTAARLGIKTAIHEQNAYPGVTTKMLLKHVDKVLLAMPEAEQRLDYKREYIVTGNPVRESLLTSDRAACRQRLGIEEGKRLVLSFGGSLGARAINEAALTLMKHASETGEFYCYHAAGRAGYQSVKTALETEGVLGGKYATLVEYIDNMDELLAAADLVICRAGAITLAELQACGKPSVLIPSPYVAENHQYFNALTLKNNGAAELIEEKELSGEKLLGEVRRLLSNGAELEGMARNAAASAITDSDKRIAEVILSLVNG